MPELTKSDILGRKDVKIERVDVPEWGRHDFVHVRSMMADERDAFEADYVEVKGTKKRLDNFRARFCVRVICDSKGTLLFEEADAAALGKKNAAAVDRIFDVGSRLAGMSEDDVKELEKNSEPGQSGASTSG